MGCYGRRFGCSVPHNRKGSGTPGGSPRRGEEEADAGVSPVAVAVVAEAALGVWRRRGASTTSCRPPATAALPGFRWMAPRAVWRAAAGGRPLRRHSLHAGYRDRVVAPDCDARWKPWEERRTGGGDGAGTGARRDHEAAPGRHQGRAQDLGPWYSKL